MTDRPLISVVIPCFNYGRFLGEAIESVLNQTYTPIELVVVDDGSTDSSQSVAAAYGVRLVSQPRSGVCIAVNTGVAVANGSLIMRLDADDVLSPTYIQEMWTALKTAPEAGFAYSDGWYTGAATGYFRLQDFNREALAEGAYVVCLALMRRDVFEEVGGYDPDMGPLRCEDWDLWLTFAEHGIWGIHVPEPLWFYRRHAGASRNTWDLSFRGLQREWRLISQLQDKHPFSFCWAALIRRVGSVPVRVVRRRMSPRHAVMLLAFCGVMLMRRSLKSVKELCG